MKKEENIGDILAFEACATEYCSFIEKLGSGKSRDLYDQLERMLGELHAAIIRIPLINAENDLDVGSEITHEQWQNIAAIILRAVQLESSALAEWHKHSNNVEPADVSRAEMLFDDLADIYRDLKVGLKLWYSKCDDRQLLAAWQWRFGYENHWGYHLFRAATTIHEINYLVSL